MHIQNMARNMYIQFSISTFLYHKEMQISITIFKKWYVNTSVYATKDLWWQPPQNGGIFCQNQLMRAVSV